MSFSSRGFSVVDRVLYILAPIEDQLCLVGLEVQLLQHFVPYGKPIFRTDSNGIGLSAQTTDSFLWYDRQKKLWYGRKFPLFGATKNVHGQFAPFHTPGS